MNLVEQVRQNRKKDLNKLKKEQLIETLMDRNDYIEKLKDIIDNQENKHQEEMQGLNKDFIASRNKSEKEYNNSCSYSYVNQILDEIAKIQTERDQYYHDLVELRENGYEDLRKENQALRNKIVRMA